MITTEREAIHYRIETMYWMMSRRFKELNEEVYKKVQNSSGTSYFHECREQLASEFHQFESDGAEVIIASVKDSNETTMEEIRDLDQLLVETLAYLGVQVNLPSVSELMDEWKSYCYNNQGTILQERSKLINLFPLANPDYIDDLMSQDLVNGPMAEEVQKRFGLYAITNSEINLTGETFERLAKSSFKVNDELGYFVNLSLVKDALLAKFSNQKTIFNSHGIQPPSWNYKFNESGVGEIANTYGTLFALGVNSEYDNTFTGENRESLSIESNSVDELQYSMKDMERIHNQKLSGTGRFVPEQTNNHTIQVQNNSAKVTTGVNTLAMAATYTEGILQGYNVSDTQLPIWKVGDYNFFTIIKPKVTRIIPNNGDISFISEPYFLNEVEARTDEGIREYADYLEMDEGLQKKMTKFWNNIRGWD